MSKWYLCHPSGNCGTSEKDRTGLLNFEPPIGVLSIAEGEFDLVQNRLARAPFSVLFFFARRGDAGSESQVSWVILLLMGRMQNTRC